MSTLIALELLLALLLWGPVEVESKVDMKHFYYSAKQDRSMMHTGRFNPDLGYNYTEAFIEGEFIRYTEMTSKTKPSGAWDDYQYLGSAPTWYLRINGKIQHDDLRDGI